MNESQAMRLKIELGKKRMLLQKQKEALEQKKREREKMGTLYTSIDKLKEEKSKDAKKSEIRQKNIQNLKVASKYIASAATIMIVVLFSIHVVHIYKDNKNRYEKFKIAMKPVSNSESLAACDFAKNFVVELNSKGDNGVSSLWSKFVDSETRLYYEVALKCLNPSEVSFNSVDRLSDEVVKVTGTHKGNLVVFMLESSPGKLSLSSVEVHL